jgi:3-oxoacyl-[acyl-carrier protein] reductase
MNTEFTAVARNVLQSFALFGKTVFISGGSRGIGRACALTLAAAGADIAVGSSPAGVESARSVCQEIEEMGRRASAYSFDVCACGDVARVCAQVADEFDSIDILVNNAGVTRDRIFRKMERREWDEVIHTDLTGVFEITQALIEPMASRGWGRVINISSIVGQIGNFGQANYAAAKAGLIGFTKTLAREYAKKGVTVNAIAPGFIRTRMLDHVPDKVLQSLTDTTPVGRLGEPMEVGASVLFLASPAASFVTGHVLDVNGGMAM